MAKRARQASASSGECVVYGEHSSSLPIPPDTHAPKYASVEPEVQPTAWPSTMRCFLPPHKPLHFSSSDEYESHYQQSHTNRCQECKKNLPTSRFLDLHIAENHDPISASKRENGEKTYGCFVDGCEKVCQDWKKRRSHLVDKHAFPRNYDFLVVDHGIDGRRSMLRPGIDAQGHRRSSRERRGSESSCSEDTQTTEATSVSAAAVAADLGSAKARTHFGQGEGSDGAQHATAGDGSTIDDLTSSMSALKMVPRTITFGKRKGRSGFAKS